MGKLKLMTIIGTRPEIIRLSATIKCCDRYFDQILVHTGQNYDYTLNQVFFDDLGLRAPDFYLDAAGDDLLQTGDSADKAKTWVLLANFYDPSAVRNMLALDLGRALQMECNMGYIRAKQIISLIVAASKLINNDPDVNDKLKVVFLEDYKVSLAEIIIPAADISEQISIAGKEASGTGNMKLMINGAVTIGTLDGANVEIHEQVGDENIFLFGMKAHEVDELWQRGYHPTEFVTPELQAVLDMLTSGVLGQRFDDLVDSLLTNRFGTADPYMTLADFQDYARAQRDVAAVYQDKQRFARMSLINIAKAGIFSSDRAVKEYADEIWDLD